MRYVTLIIIIIILLLLTINIIRKIFRICFVKTKGNDCISLLKFNLKI